MHRPVIEVTKDPERSNPRTAMDFEDSLWTEKTEDLSPAAGTDVAPTAKPDAGSESGPASGSESDLEPDLEPDHELDLEPEQVGSEIFSDGKTRLVNRSAEAEAPRVFDLEVGETRLSDRARHFVTEPNEPTTAPEGVGQESADQDDAHEDSTRLRSVPDDPDRTRLSSGDHTRLSGRSVRGGKLEGERPQVRPRLTAEDTVVTSETADLKFDESTGKLFTEVYEPRTFVGKVSLGESGEAAGSTAVAPANRPGDREDAQRSLARRKYRRRTSALIFGYVFAMIAVAALSVFGVWFLLSGGS